MSTLFISAGRDYCTDADDKEVGGFIADRIIHRFPSLDSSHLRRPSPTVRLDLLEFDKFTLNFCARCS
jgi:hypothetical protein